MMILGRLMPVAAIFANPMELKIIHGCETESGIKIPVGETVEYIAHLPWGNLKVKWAGEIHVINGRATDI